MNKKKNVTLRVYTVNIYRVEYHAKAVDIFSAEYNAERAHARTRVKIMRAEFARTSAHRFTELIYTL